MQRRFWASALCATLPLHSLSSLHKHHCLHHRVIINSYPIDWGDQLFAELDQNRAVRQKCNLSEYNHMTSLPPHLLPSPPSPSTQHQLLSMFNYRSHPHPTFQPHCHIKSRHLCSKYFNQNQVILWNRKITCIYWPTLSKTNTYECTGCTNNEHPAITFTFWNEWIQFMFDLEHR